MGVEIKELGALIIKLPYDLRVLIFKIYILYNPLIIFDIYFSDEYLIEKKEIEYSSFVRGKYIKKKKIYSLYNLIIQYELFKLKFKDIPIYYKNINDEHDSFLYNMKDLIDKMLYKSKQKYNIFKKKREYDGYWMDYSFKEIIQLDLYPVDLNEGFNYSSNIGLIIQNNHYVIETYMENCNNIEIPFSISYRF